MSAHSLQVKRLRSRPAIERLLEKIDKRGPDECWLWKGSIGTWGYGCFTLNRKSINASRAAYILLVGHVPPDKVVCHTCDNPACCNPRHLWVGAQADNLRDCRAKGRSRGQFRPGHTPLTRAMTPEQIEEAKRLHYFEGVTQTEIGRRFGFHSSVISRAVRGAR
jgi:hypothetical protein